MPRTKICLMPRDVPSHTFIYHSRYKYMRICYLSEVLYREQTFYYSCYNYGNLSFYKHLIL